MRLQLGSARADQGPLLLSDTTKCCTNVWPRAIKLTDNAIIPMKERVADRKYDLIVWLGSKISRRSDRANREEV